jgi:hypothetical protein
MMWGIASVMRVRISPMRGGLQWKEVGGMTGSAHDEVQGCLGLAGHELQITTPIQEMLSHVVDRLNPPCQTDHHEAGAQ